MGWAIRHFFNLKNAGRIHPEVLLLGAAGFIAIAALNAQARPKPAAAVADPGYAAVRVLVDRHCIMCHSANPTHRGFPTAPGGVTFDTADNLHRYAPKIYERAVASQSMPLGNETGITPEERATLGAWIKAGANTGNP